MAAKKTRRRIPLLKVKQWLPSWDDVKFDKKANQAKPEPHFYMFAMKATELKALTGIYRRSTSTRTPRADDPNVQRSHDERRSDDIRDFVKFGFPWCELSESRRQSENFDNLRKPGWLPTAIVVNIIPRSDPRNISADDVIELEETSSLQLLLPKSFTGKEWEYSSIAPLEVIDGQHRLWAFDEFDDDNDFELPVVAFHGLDRSWQAYLFWSINITPKRIKQSLAFDLYPLLRTQDWLDKFEGHSIYRETRSQELVESLWSHPKSPWCERINMLGERGNRFPMVSQAAWINSLMATLIKSWENRVGAAGGLFGTPRGSDAQVLGWNRAQQAAFLIMAGVSLRQSVKESKSVWASELRKVGGDELFAKNDDIAFYGKHTLISTDQGIRGFLTIVNDLFWLLDEDLGLSDWGKEKMRAATDEDAVSLELKAIEKTPFIGFMKKLCTTLAEFDWRSSSAPGLSEDQRLRQAVYRGSSGYRELRIQLLRHLSKEKSQVGIAAKDVLKLMGVS